MYFVASRAKNLATDCLLSQGETKGKVVILITEPRLCSADACRYNDPDDHGGSGGCCPIGIVESQQLF